MKQNKTASDKFDLAGEIHKDFSKFLENKYYTDFNLAVHDFIEGLQRKQNGNSNS